MAEFIGAILGALILNILASTFFRWLIKKVSPKVSYTKRNLIASLIVPAFSLLTNPNGFLLYLLTALLVFLVHQQTDKKNH